MPSPNRTGFACRLSVDNRARPLPHRQGTLCGSRDDAEQGV